MKIINPYKETWLNNGIKEEHDSYYKKRAEFRHKSGKLKGSFFKKNPPVV